MIAPWINAPRVIAPLIIAPWIIAPPPQNSSKWKNNACTCLKISNRPFGNGVSCAMNSPCDEMHQHHLIFWGANNRGAKIQGAIIRGAFIQGASIWIPNSIIKMSLPIHKKYTKSGQKVKFFCRFKSHPQITNSTLKRRRIRLENYCTLNKYVLRTVE